MSDFFGSVKLEEARPEDIERWIRNSEAELVNAKNDNERNRIEGHIAALKQHLKHARNREDQSI